MDKPFAITLDPDSSRANHTGTWRTERPVYVSLLPPCNNACPAGENIQQWLYQAEAGKLRRTSRHGARSWPTIRSPRSWAGSATGPARLPATGRSWTRRSASTRSSGSSATRRSARAGRHRPRRRRRASGCWWWAGPSGLSAAYHLTLLGHSVTIKDAGSEPGGMMRYGIPKYRLPRDILDAEIARILGMGATLELGTRVTDILAELREEPAATLGEETGLTPPSWPSARTSASAPTSRPATRRGSMDAVSLLHSVEDGTQPMLGRRVAVYGGGNTAMDAGRTARRLGAAEAVVVYRRTRDRMPAHDIEVAEALDEGVTMRWLSTVARADEGKLVIEKMRLDDTGFPQPTGEFEELSADCLVLALGQDADLAVLDGVPRVTFTRGTVDVGPSLMTGHPGIFAGGDMVPDERTVTVAIGHGKKAARAIDSWLRGAGPAARPRHDLAGYDRLNTWYYADAPASVRPTLEAARRIGTFDEVTGGLGASTALFEARRCMSCGNCFDCDNCYGSCPDNAVIKLESGGYLIDYDYCKGCGICAAECPCGAISMVPEET